MLSTVETSVKGGARLPLKCEAVYPLPLPLVYWLPLTPQFAFAMSLMPVGAAGRPEDAAFDATGGEEWRFMMSWGLDDADAAISLLTLRRNATSADWQLGVA